MQLFIILVLLTALYFGWQKYKELRKKYEALLEKYAMLSESAQRLANENIVNWNTARDLEVEIAELRKGLKK